MIQMYGTLLTHGGDMLIRPLGENRFSFTMLLPLSTKIKEMQAPHNLDDEALRGTETILLVDDEDMIWDVIIDMLQELGYTVILAADGRDAVEIYESNPGEIDLVILDMLMPGMDGHDTFFALKELDPNVKVLLSSGYVSEEDARDVLNAGAAGFLQKPYRMADLAQRVRTIVESGA
jgi:CheY-like chemotaxis protein